MKTLITLFLSLLFLAPAFAQLPNPDCNYLSVEDLWMDNDTASLLKVTLDNSCSNCASGLGGCVYMELKVIRTIAPFDTIGDSKCWCLWTPDNNGQRTYAIPSTVTSLPPDNTLRVSLYANGCGCDTIPFKSLSPVGIPVNGSPALYSVFPNPAKNMLMIKNPDGRQTKILIVDALGRQLYSGETELQTEVLDVSDFTAGLYFVVLSDLEKQTQKTIRITKE